MYWSCDICDKTIYEKFRNNHLESGYHKRLLIQLSESILLLNLMDLMKLSQNIYDYTIEIMKFFCHNCGEIFNNIKST